MEALGKCRLGSRGPLSFPRDVQALVIVGGEEEGLNSGPSQSWGLFRAKPERRKERGPPSDITGWTFAQYHPSLIEASYIF